MYLLHYHASYRHNVYAINSQILDTTLKSFRIMPNEMNPVLEGLLRAAGCLACVKLWEAYQRANDPAKILNDILKQPNAVDLLSAWVDKNADKLDKTLSVESGGWITDSSPEYDGPTVLVEAVFSRKIDVVKMLLGKGARIDYRRRTGKTAFMTAIGEGDLEMAKFILECPQITDKKAHINLVDNNGDSAIFFACDIYSNLRCVEFLIENGADLEHRSSVEGFSVLHKAAIGNDGSDKITALLNAGVPKDISLVKPANHTALHTAAEVGNIFTSQTLIAANLSPYEKNSKGETPLSIALSKFPQKFVNIMTFGTQFKELVESTTQNPLR